MVWYSYEALEAFTIVVWSLALVLFLVALALPCPLCRRNVKDWPTCCNKCVASILGLVFVSHLVTSDVERGMKHTNLDRWTCASGQCMIPRHEWSPRYQIAHGWKIWVWICHQGTWELMKRKDSRSIFIIFFTFILFPSHFSLFIFFTLFFLLFLLFFSSHHNFFLFFIFSFAPQNFLQHNTYIVFVSENNSSPMLERCSSSSIKERGNDC
jgi:hypothetical protein